MPVLKYSLKADKYKKLSNSFCVNEFKCNDGSDTVFISTELVEILQKIRNHFKKPVNITSAYRTQAYNTKVGGVSNSQHTKGTAADFYINNVKCEDVAKYAEFLMPADGGIGLYKNFVHIDVRNNRSRWKNYGREITVDGFFGYTEPKCELESANDIIWELGRRIEIKDVDKAVRELEKQQKLNSSLYWICRKIANSQEGII